VHVTLALCPFGPASIVQDPLRSKGTMPALKVPAVCVAASTAVFPGSLDTVDRDLEAYMDGRPR